MTHYKAGSKEYGLDHKDKVLFKKLELIPSSKTLESTCSISFTLSRTCRVMLSMRRQKSTHTSARRQHCMMAVIYSFSKELMPVTYIEPNDYIEAFNGEEVAWLRVIRNLLDAHHIPRHNVL